MKIKILVLIFLGIANFAFAEEPLSEFSEETLPILNQQLKKLEDAQVWKRDSANGQIELREAKDIDFQQQEAIEFVIENRTSDPASPVSGQIWFRTDI